MSESMSCWKYITCLVRYVKQKITTPCIFPPMDKPEEVFIVLT